MRLCICTLLAAVGCGTVSPDSSEGLEGGACFPNGTCNDGLVCLSNTCVSGVDAGGLDDPVEGADAHLPDAALPSVDAIRPDGSLPDAPLPDAAPPDAALPDAALPDAAPPDAAPPSCPDYCSLLDTNCSGTSVKQYLGSNICEAACATFEKGAAGESSGNTLACRQHHAALAGSDPSAECPAAGPGGNGECGDNCAGYCQLMMAACPGEFSGSAATCMATCATWVDTDSYTVYYRPAHSVSCALFGASYATIDPTGWCGNAAEAHCP